jgi:hypothetical protein
LVAITGPFILGVVCRALVQMARSDRYAAMLSWLRSSMGKLKAEAELFEGRHFDREVIILCVRWYLRFKLSLRRRTQIADEVGRR